MYGDPRLPERFWAKVYPEPMTGCWLWVGATGTGGYGRFGIGSKRDGSARSVTPHRYAYELLVARVGAGLEMDHVKARGCCGPACCNPAHLEPVSPRENVLRSNGLGSVFARKTHCPSGHPYDSRNTYMLQGRRYCRACNRVAGKERKRRRRREAGIPERKFRGRDG